MAGPIYSCVVDAVPALYRQVMVWAWTLIDLAGVDPAQLVVHGVEGCDERVRHALESLGVRWIPVARFPFGTAMCNKLVQLESPVLRSADRIVLSDCDVAWLVPVDGALCDGPPRAKVVDVANPPWDLLAPLFREAGFPDAETATTSLGGALTYGNNCNGGVYCLSGDWLRKLGEPWPRWLWWVGQRTGRLGRYGVHMFQVSFALAMEELGARVQHLPIEFNCPTHTPAIVDVRVTPPIRALHFHNAVDADGLLTAPGSPHVDEAVAQVNRVILRRLGSDGDGRWTSSRSWPSWDAVRPSNDGAQKPATVVVQGIHGRFLTLDDDHVTRQLRSFGAHTRNELAMLLSFLRPGDQVIDVGAHIGTFTVAFARAVGERGQVISIEPSAGAFERLAHNVALNGVASRVRLHNQLAAEAAASFRAVEEPTHTSAAFYVMTTAPSATTCLRVDALEAELLPNRPLRLIKIDVEGMELSVLHSASRLIQMHRPLLYVEVSPSATRRYFTTVEDLRLFLVGHGYRLFRNTGLRNSSNDAYVIERLESLESADSLFDCLAIPAELLPLEMTANGALAAAMAGSLTNASEVQPHQPAG